MPADGDLDDTVRRADPVRWLASRFVGDLQARADVVAIYAFDHAVARVATAAKAARSLPIDFVLTARAENFIHGRADLDDTGVPGLGDDVLDSDVLACCHPRVEAEGSQLRVPVHVSLGPHFGLG